MDQIDARNVGPTSAMHADQLLTMTTLLLAVSAAAIIVSRRAGFGSILGLLAAGILLGPHTPGPVVDIGQLRSMTELGVVFLLQGCSTLV